MRERWELSSGYIWATGPKNMSKEGKKAFGTSHMHHSLLTVNKRRMSCTQIESNFG
jgi:hypothetical protein